MITLLSSVYMGICLPPPSVWTLATFPSRMRPRNLVSMENSMDWMARMGIKARMKVCGMPSSDACICEETREKMEYFHSLWVILPSPLRVESVPPLLVLLFGLENPVPSVADTDLKCRKTLSKYTPRHSISYPPVTLDKQEN